MPRAFADASHSFNDNTDDDTHIVDAANTSEIYYMLFAGQNGREFTDAEMTVIAEGLIKIVDPKAAQSHTCRNVADGIKCFGKNGQGQLGLGDTLNRGDEALEMGENLPTVNLGQGFVVAQFVSGARHNCALSTAGTVKCWGGNQNGQLGLGDILIRGNEPLAMGDDLPVVDLGQEMTVKALYAGLNHTCALSLNGRVKCWGKNNFAQLGLGHADDIGDQTGEMGDALPWLDLGTGRQALELALGSNHSCVLFDDESVRCFGNNNYGQLATGDAQQVGNTPQQMGDQLRRVNHGHSAEPVKITAGDTHTCILFSDHKAKCFGQNISGQLGIGDAAMRGHDPETLGEAWPFVDLGPGQRIKDLACGGSSCCAVLMQNTMKCFGANANGQLGIGDNISRGSTPQTIGDGLPFTKIDGMGMILGIDHYGNHACVELQTISGELGLKCFGANSHGQLGLGDSSNRGDTLQTTPDQQPFVEL